MDYEELLNGLRRFLNHRPAMPVPSLRELFGGDVVRRGERYYRSRGVTLGPVAEVEVRFPPLDVGKLLFDSTLVHEASHQGQLPCNIGLELYESCESFVSWARSGFEGPSIPPLPEGVWWLEAYSTGLQYVFLGSPGYHIIMYERYGDEFERDLSRMANPRYSCMLEESLASHAPHKMAWEFLKSWSEYAIEKLGFEWFVSVYVAFKAVSASYFSSLEPKEVLRRYVSLLKRGIDPNEVQPESLGISPELLKRASSRLRSIGLERSDFLADILAKEEPGTWGELADALASMVKKLPIVVFDGRRRYVGGWIPDNDLVLGFYVDLSVAGQVRDLLAGLGEEVRCPLCFSDQFKGAPHKCANCPGLLYPEVQFWDGCPFLREWKEVIGRISMR